jgi:hypothetical protein
MQFPISFRRRNSTTCAAICIFILLDILLFRTGFYYRYIKLNSAAGIFKFRSSLGGREPNSSENLVAALGDSRIAQGFSSKYFDQSVKNKSWHAINLGMPGSTLRVWYYLLNQIDAKRDKFKIVLIPLNSYWDFDETRFENPTNRILDLQFLSPYISSYEAFDVARTFTDGECQRESIIGTTLRMYALRRDVRDFLFNPKERLSNLKTNRDFHIVDYNFDGIHGRLVDMLEAANNAVVHDENVTTIVNRLKTRFEDPLPPQTGDRFRYNKFWLSRMVSAYRNSNTKLVFTKIPADPIRRRFPIPKDYSAVHSLPTSHNLVLAPETLFSDLENAEYFYDDLHLNYKGRKIFSERIASFISENVVTQD